KNILSFLRKQESIIKPLNYTGFLPTQEIEDSTKSMTKQTLLNKITTYIKNHKITSAIIIIILIAYYFCLPKQLFKEPTATVITSNHNELLGAQIATDGQWRFPQNDSIPEKFKICIIQFEDAYFYKRSEEHTSELQSRENLVCRLLLE